jgi:hypothetical protein
MLMKLMMLNYLTQYSSIDINNDDDDDNGSCSNDINTIM